MEKRYTLIISCFPGIGRDWAYDHMLCSTVYNMKINTKELQENRERCLHKYVSRIKSLMGSVDYIFIDPCKDVRNTLYSLYIQYLTVIPSEEDFNNYKKSITDTDEMERLVDLYADCKQDVDAMELPTGKYLYDMFRAVNPDCIYYSTADQCNVRVIDVIPSSGDHEQVVYQQLPNKNNPFMGAVEMISCGEFCSKNSDGQYLFTDVARDLSEVGYT